MRRRDFLALSGMGLSGSLVGCTALPRANSQDIYARIVAANAANVRRILGRQITDPAHPAYGGIQHPHDLHHPGPAAGLLRDIGSAYACPDGPWHQDATLLPPMALAAEFLLRCQHPDGTIDLLTTNFHSPPDTGFVLEWACGAAGVLRDATDADTTATVAREAILADLMRFITRAAAALVVGGIHTPNHRWVVCMALARCHALTPNPRYVQRIDMWLAEGIDIDPDGQFTERSTTVYSPLTDRCLITVARILDRAALLEPVRRNLAMTLYYLHANGDVVTEASRRQDQYKQSSAARYYYPYRYMALHDGDGRFAAMAEAIETAQPNRLTHQLFRFLEQPALRRPLPATAPLPTDFEKGFRFSGLVRIRRGPLSATILADNATFFSLHKGAAAVVVRFASAFFGKGQFVGQDLHKAGDSLIMEQSLVGPYYQPIAPELRSPDGNWEKMPRDRRPQSEVQRSRSIVRIREGGGGFDVDIEITGAARVPVAIELGFGAAGRLSGTTPIDDSTHLLRAGDGRYTLGTDTITFGPGAPGHRWTQLRGALPKLPGRSVYITGTTPFRQTLRFR